MSKKAKKVGIHKHKWVCIEVIGNVATFRCAICGKTKLGFV